MKKKTSKHIIRLIAIALLSLLVISLSLGAALMNLSKVKTKNQPVLEKIEINGLYQWISMSDTRTPAVKPIVLFLHGGPGSANMALLNQNCPGLAEAAVIVNWDQRGAGKSFSIWQPLGALSLEQSIADAHVLTQYLKEKFQVKKITLLGFSAGSTLGVLLAQRYPQDYARYIGVGQEVDGTRAEQLSLQFTINAARAVGDEKAVKKLENISYDFSHPETIYKQINLQRTYLLRYGGVYHHYTSYSHEAASLWKANEYSFFDFLAFPLASSLSLKTYFHEIVQVNLLAQVPALEIPVVFISGRYDMNTPLSLVEEYYTHLQAPEGKNLLIFEDSAHAVFWDEPQHFEAALIEILSSDK